MELNVGKYWAQEAVEYRENAYKHKEKSTRYPFYEVRLNLVEDMIKNLPCGKMLDAGCGGGNVLIHFLKKGWDGYGCDLVPEMVELAHENLEREGFETHRIHQAPVEDLSKYEDSSFDIILSLGVMEYLPEGKESLAFKEAARVLKPEGKFIIENINNLFDLTTFNRFTVEFFKDHFLSEFFDPKQIEQDLEPKLKALMTNPEKPSKKGTYTTTRDEVFTKSEIPMVYSKKAETFGFKETEQAFYRFHAVPPLFFEQNPELEKLTIDYELKLSRHWIGNFLASGFISVLEKK